MFNKQRASQIDQQFRFQAEWTAPLRDYILKQANFPTETRILEIGCGTGAILQDLFLKGYSNLYGVDINLEGIRFATQSNIQASYINANGFFLPFPPNSFDVCVFHYFLLWISPLEPLLKEVIRVIRKNGVIMAMAEPDYMARIDYPDELQKISQIQNLALARSGADIAIGRKLKEAFSISGMKNIHGGIIGQEWTDRFSQAEFEFEWNYLEQDLSPFIPYSEVQELRELDYQARIAQRRILYIPTCWAIGWT